MTDGVTQVELSITGMHCGSCSALIEESLAELPGVASSAVDLEAALATVDFRPDAVTVAQLCQVVADAGYGAIPVEPAHPGP